MKMSCYRIILNLFTYIIFLCCIQLSLATIFKDCGSIHGTVKKVTVSGCDDSMKICVLHQNSKANVAISFTSTEIANKTTAVVHGIIHEVPIPFPLPQADACVNSGLTCPLKPAQSYVYIASLEVKSTYPKLQLIVKWELRDDHEEDLVCIMIPAEIQGPTSEYNSKQSWKMMDAVRTNEIPN